MRAIQEMLEAFLVPPRFDWLQLEVAGACNATCAYCTLTDYKRVREGGFMDMATFERMEPHFSSAALVYLQGWGEPLLHPQFWEMARRAKASGARVGFTTNGTRLDEANLARLLDTPIDIMGVSIAGTTAATSDRGRQGCDFARLGASLSELKRMKGARGGEGTAVHLAFMLFASNWRELDALPALAEAWGASEVVVSNLSFIGDPAQQQESLFERPDLWAPVFERVEAVREQAAARGIALHYSYPDRREAQALCSEHVLNACFVSWQGNVAPCVLTNQSIKAGAAPTHLFRGQNHPVGSCVFGNVNETPFEAIWKSDAARAFRAAFVRRQKRKQPGTDDLPESCRHCYKLYER
jgi:MoaA/NifB/PqqE/SkfB family radical SAM enzyme